VRKTKSRFGARLEPLSHVELLLHQGGSELQTVTGAELIRSHRAAREEPYRLGVGLVGAEAMLRLFPEQEANPRAFHALTRFLDLLDELEPPAPETRGSADPLVLSFQLKLIWLSGYLPHLAGCAACGEEKPLIGFSARAGGSVCADCEAGAVPVSGEGFEGIRALLERPLAQARESGLGIEALRQCLQVIEATYEEHGGFRLRTLAQTR
jgi:DNA repair protein RecO (recombination protein O)